MLIQRKELLNRLLAVSPGLNRKDSIQSTVVLRKGRFYTMSNEIACSLVSGLPSIMEGAIRADKLIEFLKALPEDELDIEIESKTLYLKAKGMDLELAMEGEILLAIDEVELPKEWSLITQEFSEAVDLVWRCSAKKGDFTKQSVHLAPTHIESSDDIKAIKYKIPTFVKESVLVRGESIKHIVQLGFSKAAETVNWLHFRNPFGLRMSIRKFGLESYPDLESFLSIRGPKVVFPKALEEIALIASILDKDSIKISIGNGKLTIESLSEEGKYKKRKKIAYTGKEMSFVVPPKLVAELVNKSTNCEVTNSSLRVNGGKYVFASTLERKI